MPTFRFQNLSYAYQISKKYAYSAVVECAGTMTRRPNNKGPNRRGGRGQSTPVGSAHIAVVDSTSGAGENNHEDNHSQRTGSPNVQGVGTSDPATTMDPPNNSVEHISPSIDTTSSHANETKTLFYCPTGT